MFHEKEKQYCHKGYYTGAYGKFCPRWYIPDTILDKVGKTTGDRPVENYTKYTKTCDKPLTCIYGTLNRSPSPNADA